MTDSLSCAKLKPWHLDRLAVIYVRQSDPQQRFRHPESTALQYALADRAFALGWPRDRIVTIDEDQGKTASTAEGRLGFHHLLAEVALDHVGLILGREVSRPARNCKDWYHLLELCARFGTLLGDSDGLYNPADYNDRLLLGLKGIMGEAELHILKDRMNTAKLNKARRGELFVTAPIGYVKTPAGLVIDPDEQVQATVRLIFDQFDRQGALHGVLDYLVANQINIPVRSRLRSNYGQLQWHKPSASTLLNLLHHPIYAGAYRYGCRVTDPAKQKPGRRETGKRRLPAEQCLVLIRDHLPAYISWEQFEANQQRLQANRSNRLCAGTVRRGPALLGGLIYCGLCARRMQVRYGSRKTPCYGCAGKVMYGGPRCQSLTGVALDELVARQILVAAQPAALEASLAAVADIERERAELLRQWTLKIERVNYEVNLACRQYQACEPENRLVARSLERNWEEALQRQRQLNEEFERWQQSVPTRLSEQDRQRIRALAADLPAIWHAETTTHQDRKQIARLLLERVTVIVDKESEQVDVELRWVGEQTTRHSMKRRVNSYEQTADYPRLVQRLKELSGMRLSSSEIAEKLNGEGFHPVKRTEKFTGAVVLRLLSEVGLSQQRRHGSKAGLGKDEFRPAGLARRLRVKRHIVRGWMRAGWVSMRKDEQGHNIIWADADERRRLLELHGLPRTRANKQRVAQLKKPKQRPLK